MVPMVPPAHTVVSFRDKGIHLVQNHNIKSCWITWRQLVNSNIIPPYLSRISSDKEKRKEAKMMITVFWSWQCPTVFESKCYLLSKMRSKLRLLSTFMWGIYEQHTIMNIATKDRFRYSYGALNRTWSKVKWKAQMFAAVKMMGIFFCITIKLKLFIVSVEQFLPSMLGPNCPLIHTEPIMMP